MPYEPNPFDETQPDEGVFAGTAAAEFRAMKVALAALLVGVDYDGEWSTLTGAAARGTFVTHADSLWLLRVALADITTVEPTPANAATWFRVLQQSTGGYVTKTADTGSALIPAGTVAQRDVTPTSGAVRFNTDTPEWEGYDGTAWSPFKKKRRAVLSTASGSALVEHTGIPAGVEDITLVFDKVSLNGTEHVLVRIGIAASMAATGYADCRGHAISSSAFATDTNTTGFIMRISNAGRQISGEVQLKKGAGNKWYCTGSFTASDIIMLSTGSKDLAADVLTRVGVIPSGGSFDSGEVQVFY